eukprot:4550058-Prymnesium_polylepis.2
MPGRGIHYAGQCRGTVVTSTSVQAMERTEYAKPRNGIRPVRVRALIVIPHPPAAYRCMYEQPMYPTVLRTGGKRPGILGTREGEGAARNPAVI